MNNKELNRMRYLERIYKVQDYIDKNLDKDLTLEELANVCGFSEYHFHRIFSSIVGETLYQYIKRIRIEKSISMLVLNPKMSITEIVFECGFSSPSVFSRSFKDAIGISPSEYKKKHSKNCKVVSKNRKETSNESIYNKDIQNKFVRSDFNMIIREEVSIKKLEKKDVIYVRHTGPYKGDGNLFEGLFNKLCGWAGARDLIKHGKTEFLTIYHDGPEITEEDKLRISLCMTVDLPVDVDGEIGSMNIEGGKYAVGHFELAVDEYQQAWNYLFSQWLPESGYQVDNRPCFEMYLNSPEEHPENKHLVDIHVPIKPL